MAKRIPWEEEEALLLLDAYSLVQKNPDKRSLIAEALSINLRRRAIDRHIVIDDTFRNYNGISIRLLEIDKILHPDDKSFGNTSLLFINTTDLYLNHKKTFRKKVSALEEYRVKILGELVAFSLREAVILLDAYLGIDAPGETRAHTARLVSAKLRVLAKNTGCVFTDGFRTEDGINNRLARMEIVYTGQNPHQLTLPQVFIEAVNLYRTKKREYKTILKETNRIIGKIILPEDAAKAERERQKRRDAEPVKKTKYIRTKKDRKLNEQYGKAFIAVYGALEKRFYSDPWGVTATDIFTDLKKKYPRHDIITILTGASWSQQIKEGKYIHARGASIMSDIESKQKAFFRWADAEMAKRQADIISKKGSGVSAILLQKRAISKPLWEIDDIDTIERLIPRVPFCFANSKMRATAMMVVKSYAAYLEGRQEGYIPEVFTEAPSGETTENSAIKSLLTEHYQYGFRYDSIREIIRFRQLAEDANIHIPEDDELLREAILASGTVVEDKLYCFSDDLPRTLRQIVDEIFGSGPLAIYYDCLLDQQNERLSTININTEDILKELLMKYIPGCAFSKKFMSKGRKRTERVVVSEEIVRIWGDEPIESVDDLSNRLPYVPKDNIWRVITGNDRFVYVSTGKYLFVDRFQVSASDEKRILNYIEDTCKQNGYCSLSDIPLGDIPEKNYELPYEAIINAVYKKILAGRYFLNGKILTVDHPELDAISLLKNNIRGRDECTFNEIAVKSAELTGKVNRQYAFRALYDELVRVDKNRFVSESHISFDVDAIDKILAGFVVDHFCAIRDITTFVTFPLCGQSWNYFLLESYCYRFSEKYKLMVIGFSDWNAGIISEKGYDKSYSDLLAIALARSDIELTPDVAGKYLAQVGYMVNSRYAMLDGIVQQAIDIRKER